MIDTIRLSIHSPIKIILNQKMRIFNKKIYNLFLDNCNQKTSGFITNSKTGLTIRQSIFQLKVNNFEEYEMLILNGSLKCPSYNYEIFFRIFEERIDLEFSLPKFIYGNNCFELYTHSNFIKLSPYQIMIQAIKKFFIDIFFNVKIDFGAVEILRFDFCFNQVFKSYEQSLIALNYIKLKHSAVCDKLNYKFGFVELTKNNYLKIYHKGTEYFKNTKSENFSKKIFDFSNRILRFEKKHTIKNIAYFYNCNFKNAGRHFLKKEYLEQKKKNKIDKFLRGEFENVQRFTLANSVLNNCVILDEKFFNLLYKKFLREIVQKFNISNLSVKTLYNEVLNEKKNKAVNIRILSLITTFKSLRRAFDNNAISSSTYYRYKNILSINNLSETNVKTNIFQDFTKNTYLKHLKESSLFPTIISKISFF